MDDPLDFVSRLASFESAQYEELRPDQLRALEGYAAHVDADDIAVELPTGYGKTLVALMIADLALERGQTVAYLTGNNLLTDQVVGQGKGLPGLDLVKFAGGHYPPADLAAYHDAQAVGVMNYWTYFNSSPKVEPADLVIFDDAHLAEQPLAGMFAIRVDHRRQAALYDALCDLVLEHTDLYPSIRLMRERSAGPTTPPELIAFTHWARIADDFTAKLGDGLPEKEALYVWPRVRPHLPACGVLVGPWAIEIRPYVPPTQILPGYKNARQRLYLSATLGTSDDLQRRLGIGPVVRAVDTVVAVGAVGTRLFLLNPDQARLHTDGSVKEFTAEQLRQAGRAAWLCASGPEADLVEDLLANLGLPSYRLRRGGEDGILDRWAGDPHGQLVTAGRYDGLDLANDLCRLVVLPSIPAASTEFERFVMAYLGDAAYMRHRVGQRVTQALGRANREEGDWAMYLGLDPGFGTLLAQSAVQAATPGDVRPAIDAALNRLQEGWAGTKAVANEFWEQRGAVPVEGVVPARGDRVRPGRARPAATAGSAQDEVSAVTSLWLGDYPAAAEAATRAAATLDTAGEAEHAAFWRYVQAQARYSEGGPAAVRMAINALRASAEGATATAWFVRLRRALAEMRGEQAVSSEELPWAVWDEWLREAGSSGVLRAVERCLARIQGTHDQQAAALEILGRMAGAVAQRPTRRNAGTDAVWTWSSGRRVERRLWEVKTGDPHQVPRDWVNQNLGQITEERTSGSRKRVLGCLLTHLTEVEDVAARAARDDIAILHVDAVTTLAETLGRLLTAYATDWGGGSAAERGAAREAVEPSMPTGPWLADLTDPTGGRILRAADVEARLGR